MAQSTSSTTAPTTDHQPPLKGARLIDVPTKLEVKRQSISAKVNV
jgi:hypothetical protein